MTTVTVHNKFTEILASFGDVQESVNTAVQRYAIEQITNKITELRRKDEEFQKNTDWIILPLSNTHLRMMNSSKQWKSGSARHGRQIWLTGNSVIGGSKIGRKNCGTFC